MNELESRKLSEIGCEFLSGFAFKSSDYSASGIPLIKIGNIQNRLAVIDEKGDKVHENLITGKQERYLLSNDDILIAMTGQGSVGRVGRLKLRKREKALLNQRVGKFVCDEIKLNADYLYYILTTDKYQDYLFNTGAGSGQPNLSPELILNTEIPWIEYKHQKAIASILSSLDDKIDLLHRQNATLEKMAETLFRQWFVEEAKEEWETAQLREVTRVAIGRTPPRKEAHWFSKNQLDVKWISIKDLGNDGVFITNTSEYLTRDAIKTFNIPLIPKGTVVLSFKMTVGRVAITSEEMTSNEAIAHFRFKSDTPFTKEYLFLFLKTYKYESLGSTSSIVTAINSDMIKHLEIPIPDQTVMQAFHNQAKPIFDKIKHNQAQIGTLVAFRDTLLPKLMSAEVAVNNINLK